MNCHSFHIVLFFSLLLLLLWSMPMNILLDPSPILSHSIPYSPFIFLPFFSCKGLKKALGVGNNRFGQLGILKKSFVRNPTLIDSLQRYSNEGVACGAFFSLILVRCTNFCSSRTRFFSSCDEYCVLFSADDFLWSDGKHSPIPSASRKSKKCGHCS